MKSYLTYLQIDYYAWTVFGLAFVILPDQAIRVMTNVKPDNVNRHMFSVFGIMCAYSANFSYLAYQNQSQQEAKNAFKLRLIYSFLILLYMLVIQRYQDRNDWSDGHYLGMIGLVLNMVNAYLGYRSLE